MVADSQSRFTFLAADLLSAAQPSPTPLQKTRVGGFRRPIITPGSRACGYKTASGRHEWLNRDPIQELGGLNLYDYVANNPINYFDLYGLSFWGRVGNGFTGLGTGLVSGAGTGAAVGAGIGAVGGLGVGDAVTVPAAAGAGAVAGGIAGAIGGFVGGVLSGPNYNAGQSAGAGAINGGLAGLTGGAGEVGGIAWGAGTGALVGGTSAGLSTDGDPGAIAGGAFFGGGLGGLGAAASGLSPWESGVFAPTGEILGQDVGGYIDLFNNFPGPNSPKKPCP